ncbi:hypothetical protein PGT21_010130 [Puccinia graminis f. sp. tritici]|uniref:Uncharacterized protein n=1 Tax=Puccinia graminis f. sp. tritici TaxID=56615 RepID=A0A5B0MKD4_PUCGR|nr:hypothetical protein PGT21_010130 [Puccinia graminis f. sp. tritici]
MYAVVVNLKMTGGLAVHLEVERKPYIFCPEPVPPCSPVHLVEAPRERCTQKGRSTWFQPVIRIRSMMSFSTTLSLTQPRSTSSPAPAHPRLLTVKLYPSLSSSAIDPSTSGSSNQIISVSSSQSSPHSKFLVQHYHLPRSSVRLPYNSYLIDLNGSSEHANPGGTITAIELAVTNRAALSPCLVFGTTTGALYLTRSDFSRPHSKLRQLHRSPILALASCPLDILPTVLISGSSTELLLWDLDDRSAQPTCLRAFGRQNPKFLSNPYASVLVGVQFRRLSNREVNVLAEFEDGLISCWNLNVLLHRELIKPKPSLFSAKYQKSFPLLDACCASAEDNDFHVFAVDPQDGWVQKSQSGRNLFQLSSSISRFVCISCDHQTQKIELLALFQDTQQLMKIAIDDSSHTEPPGITMTQVESDCTFFHYDRSDGWLVTCKSTTQEMSVRQIDRSLPIAQSYDMYTQTHLKRSYSSVIRNPGFLTLEIIQGIGDSQSRDSDLIKLLRAELDQRLKFPSHLRLAIYKRMLIKSKSQEEELTTTYYRYLSRPSPEVFMKKFRAAWKLEEAEFQFSLETLLSIFHGMEKYSESSLVDKLAPILYSFLKILESAEEINKSDDGEESIELVEIYKVGWLMIDRFGEGAFGEKGNSHNDRKKNYEVFAEKVTQRLLDHRSSIGRSLLEHLGYHSVSIGVSECFFL